jgi:predicted kinase
LRSDVERKVIAGVSELARLPASAYTPEARQRVYRGLHDKAAAILKAGHCVVLDAVYDSETERREIEQLANKLNVPMHGLWLRADAASLVARVEGRCGDASDATAEVVHHQMAADVGNLSLRWHSIDACGKPADTLRAAMSALAPGACGIRMAPPRTSTGRGASRGEVTSR